MIVTLVSVCMMGSFVAAQSAATLPIIPPGMLQGCTNQPDLTSLAAMMSTCGTASVTDPSQITPDMVACTCEAKNLAVFAQFAQDCPTALPTGFVDQAKAVCAATASATTANTSNAPIVSSIPSTTSASPVPSPSPTGNTVNLASLPIVPQGALQSCTNMADLQNLAIMMNTCGMTSVTNPEQFTLPMVQCVCNPTNFATFGQFVKDCGFALPTGFAEQAGAVCKGLASGATVVTGPVGQPQQNNAPGAVVQSGAIVIPAASSRAATVPTAPSAATRAGASLRILGSLGVVLSLVFT
ncbi:hypothetical protein BC830DRAFT_1173478 [Chytriomyces sp. MP71]|nr:hypothetical protein BC830DRAFT_1173478 [Chytriomyces sp. MP71]